jgi:putative DNA primase/helicase
MLTEMAPQSNTSAATHESGAWAARAKDLASWAWDRYVIRDDVWGGYNPIDQRDKERVNSASGEIYKLGATKTCPPRYNRGKVLLTPQILERHFKATCPEQVVGIHTTSTDNRSRFGTIEVDNHGADSTPPEVNRDTSLTLYKRTAAMGFHPVLWDSNGRGGYHLDLLFREPVPTRQLFWFLRWLVRDWPALGLPARPETFPKQSALKPRDNGKGKYGNWCRLPGLHHTRKHWARVWDGSAWLAGAEAVAHLLTHTGDDPSLVRPDCEEEIRVGAYLAKLPNLGEGQGRDDVAFNFACFLARDLALPDSDCLRWLSEWDGGNRPPKGYERLREILDHAKEYGTAKPRGGNVCEPLPSPFSGRAIGSRLPDGVDDGAEAPDDETPVQKFATTDKPAKRNEALDDPHRLARVYRNSCRVGQHDAVYRYRGEFLHWVGGAYQPVSDEQTKGALTATARAEFEADHDDKLRRWQEKKTQDPQTAGSPPVMKKVESKLVGNVNQALLSVSMLDDNVLSPSWLGAPGPFAASETLACQNGLIHLPSFVTRSEPWRCDPTPQFFTRNALNFPFNPDAPAPTLWLEHLSKWWPDDPECINALQEWFGYVLLPDTSQHKIFLLTGPPRSGKGTIVRVLRKLVGEINTCSPTLASLSDRFGLQPLLDKTLATITDARLSGRTDIAVVTERLLSISGEDAQTIDRKHKPSVTAPLPVRFMILSNELPRLNDASGALVSRLVVLQQKVSWRGREDVNLTNRLLTELPGILLWSIEGWRRLKERGHFVTPASSRSALSLLEEMSSPVKAFLNACCELGSDLSVDVDTMFTAWKTWADDRGLKPLTSPVFGRDLRAACPTIDTARPRLGACRSRVYTGVKLSNTRIDETSSCDAADADEGEV